MVAARGTIQLIALYQQQALPLHASKIMNKRLIAGSLMDEAPVKTIKRAIDSMEQGVIQIKEMITHRFAYTEAKSAFDFLWQTPEKGLGVLLDWQT